MYGRILALLVAGAQLCLLEGLLARRGGFVSRGRPFHRALRAASTESASAGSSAADDIAGDGGVMRRILSSGETGEDIGERDIVVVDYEGFEHPSGRALFKGEGLQMVIGDGTMIKAWDVGLVGMKEGETAELIVKPEYAYGAEGVPPVLGPASMLRFVISLKERKGNSQAVRIFTDMDPLLPRTPESIRAAYSQRQQDRADELQAQLGDGPIDRVKKWFASLYIFGFFSEGAPWYLNPGITFPAIFAGVLAGSYFVYSLGAVTLERTDTSVPAIETYRAGSTIDDIEDD